MKNNVFKNFIYSLKKVWKIDKSYIILGVISSILSAINVYVYSYTIKVAVSAIENSDIFEVYLLKVLLTVVIGLIISCIINIIDNYFWVRVDDISINLSREFYMNSLKIDYEKFERTDIQDLHQRASMAVSYNGILGMIQRGVQILRSFASVIIAFTIILQVSWLLIIIIVTCAIIKYLIGIYNEKLKKKELYDKLPNLNRKITYANNIVKNQAIGKDIRIYDMNLFVEKKRDEVVKEYCRLYKKYMIKDFFLSLIKYILNIIDELALYGFMIFEVIYNGMLISTFSFMLSSVRNLISSFSSFIFEYSYLVECSLSVNDYREFINKDLFIEYEINKCDFEFESLEFKNVSYSYYLQDGKALDNVSFKINKNEKIALVGYNGAGKTTLIKLICGLYHPTEGEILLNGINIEKIDRSELSKYLAPVFQDTIHYSINIEENISFEIDPDDNKIDNVLNYVDLYEKVGTFPNKKKTIVSRDIDEKGIDLSGGESQKLSLARAIYKKAPLMMLDEPTSAMDAISEANLYNNINQILSNNTVIFISHRLSSTKFCDRIIMLEKGKIIEEGTHNDLLNKNAEYAKLFNMQASYYKGGEDNE